MNIFKKMSVYTVGNLLGSGIQFFLLPLLTRHLSPSEYGTLAVYQVISQVLIILVLVGADSFFGVEIFKVNAEERKSLLLSLLIIPVSIFLVSSLALWLLFPNMSHFLGIDFLKWDVQLLLIVAISFVPHTFILGILRSDGKAKQFLAFQLLYLGLNFLFSYLFIVVFPFGFRGRLIAIALSPLLSFAFLLRNLKFDLSLVLKNRIFDSLKFGWPLIVHGFFGIFLVNGDRLILSKFLDERMVGIYTVSSQIASILLITGTGVNQAWSPYLCEALEKRRLSSARILKLLIFLNAFFLFSMISSYFLLPLMLGLLTSKSYAESETYLPYFLVANLFNCFYYLVSVFLFYFKKTRILSFTTASITCISFAVSYFAVDTYGIYGMLWVKIAAWLFFFVITSYHAYQLMKQYDLGNTSDGGS